MEETFIFWRHSLWLVNLRPLSHNLWWIMRIFLDGGTLCFDERKKMFFLQKKVFSCSSFFLMPVLKELGNPCCQFGEPPHFKYLQLSTINKLSVLNFEIFSENVNKKVVCYSVAKKCLTIFFFYKARYLWIFLRYLR